MKEETKCYCGHTTYCDCGPETLEEAAERLYPIYDRFKYDEDWVEDVTKRREDFIKGAKWQQEHIGKSEFLQKLRATLSDAEARRLIFETFKNK